METPERLQQLILAQSESLPTTLRGLLRAGTIPVYKRGLILATKRAVDVYAHRALVNARLGLGVDGYDELIDNLEHYDGVNVVIHVVSIAGDIYIIFSYSETTEILGALVSDKDIET
jgi:hypothetical protein